MNIFEQAMEIEREGESLYRDLAKEAPDKGLKNIFTRLADQEVKHYGIFQKMKEGAEAQAAEGPVLSGIKDIFESWRANKAPLNIQAPQVDFYRKALALEAKSVSAYEKYAALSASPQKEILLKIAAEERSHQRIVENIIEFVTKPEIWVENAEFNHIEEDYYL